MSFFRYFWGRTGENGGQFVAITDPGMSLEQLGREVGFRQVFLNPADIGGRYSALSLFGLVPAALMGIDITLLLERAEAMAQRCALASENPGALLGALMAEASVGGRDKLTFVPSPRIGQFGLWAEQLIAESTGKQGKGIVPIASEPATERPRYTDDRLFVAMMLDHDHSEGVTARLHDIETAGNPLVRLVLSDPYDLGSEFFRWEFATAVAGAVLGVNPFDQPNVAESKQNTKQALSEPAGLLRPPGPRRSRVVSFLGGVRPGDYISVQAFIEPTDAHDSRLASLCSALRDRVDAAVTFGYGPRYLHSTGQLHKGGPNTGHFIQVMDQTDVDAVIPDAEYSFRQLLAAQADGDLEALAARGRPVIRVSDPADLMELM
jgi:glucose-6-phosphate isomerase/transaldolase/glucose-6-phosphate isomerase